VRRYVIGTAGHVDHGKTTLVRALTGVDTDRLPEEKRRGISIELGFAPLDLGGECLASVVDVPGHRRLVRTMIAGASGIELVLLVVAADEGVMPQTREHVAVCELLGMTRAVVAVTKADAVDPELAQMAAEEARGLLGDRWSVAGVVTCSAKTGAGLDGLRTALRAALVALPAPPARAHARLGVDRVFTVRGAGTVVTGTLVAGTIAVGDALFVVGERAGRAETVARGLHVHDASVERAGAPTRLALNLGGVALEDVRRGDVVTSDPALRATTLVDVLVRGPLGARRAAALTAHVGTASSAARVDSVDAVAGGCVVRVRLAHPVAIAGGDRVVLRGGAEGPSGAIAGGGVVVDARADRRGSGAGRRALAAALASLDAAATVRALVEAAAPRPLLRESLAARFAIDGGDLARAADALAQARALAPLGPAGWTDRARLEASAARARDLVRRHGEEHPLDRGMPLETLRARLAAGGGRLVAEEALRRARVAIDGDVARLPDGTPGAEALALVATVDRVLREAGAAGASEFTIGERTKGAAAPLRAALARLEREGRAVRLGSLWLARDVVDEARRRVVEHFAGGARSLTVIEFKKIAGLARNQAVAVLEHFDAVGLTRRDGDARVLR
jgi:selenocysteine-specific elongation factor